MSDDVFKAYESINHEWMDVMKQTGVEKRNNVSDMFEKRKNQMFYEKEEECERRVRTGIFQSDSLSSSALFHVMNPLSKKKREVECPQSDETTTPTTSSMNDLKVGEEKMKKGRKHHQLKFLR